MFAGTLTSKLFLHFLLCHQPWKPFVYDCHTNFKRYISLYDAHVACNFLLLYSLLQEHLLQSYFSIFYFAINLGSLLSTVITPILRGTLLLNYYYHCTMCIISRFCLCSLCFCNCPLHKMQVVLPGSPA